MMKGNLKNTGIMGLFFLLYSSILQAGVPLWTFTPLTPTTLTITNQQTAVVKYIVANQSLKMHTLVIEPMEGITQLSTEPGYCNPVFPLTFRGSVGSSCILALKIDGSQLSNPINGGPNVCQQGSILQCYRPAAANILRVNISDTTPLPPPVVTYTIGGQISGLTGSVITLQNNGSDDVTRMTDGTYTFGTPIADGDSYLVTVVTQPTGKTCTVNNASGTVSGANVTNVNIVCAINAYTVGGNISGLSNTVSLDNNGDPLVLTTNGSFTFPTPLASGSSYNVIVQTQPTDQNCVVTNGSGNINNSNVTNIIVSCIDTTTLSVDANGTIPATLARSSMGSIQVNNLGPHTALNVELSLPVAWTSGGAVVQDSTNCSSVLSGNSCTVTFTSTAAFIAQGNIPVIGSNISNTPTTSIAFTVDGYLVWDVSGASVQVIDTADLASDLWTMSSDLSPTSNTGAQSPSNGASNTAIIVSFINPKTSALLVRPYAAYDCYASTSGGASSGNWYLPAVCQMSPTEGFGGFCSVPGVPNIQQNLSSLGFGGFSGNSYWSSTENPTTPNLQAKIYNFAFNSVSNAQKNFSNAIRCARTLIIP